MCAQRLALLQQIQPKLQVPALADQRHDSCVNAGIVFGPLCIITSDLAQIVKRFHGEDLLLHTRLENKDKKKGGFATLSAVTKYIAAWKLRVKELLQSVVEEGGVLDLSLIHI